MPWNIVDPNQLTHEDPDHEHISNSCEPNNCTLCTCTETPESHCTHCYHCIECSSTVARGCRPCAHALNHRAYRTYIPSRYRLANGNLTDRDPRRSLEDEEPPSSPEFGGLSSPMINPVTPPNEAQYLTPESLGTPTDSPEAEEPIWPDVESGFGFSPCVYPYTDDMEIPSPAPSFEFDDFEVEVCVNPDSPEIETSEDLRVQALIALETIWGGHIDRVPGYIRSRKDTGTTTEESDLETSREANLS